VGIDVQQPWFLLLLIPAAWVIAAWWRGQRRMPNSRKTVIAAVRGAVFLLLILALAGTQLLHPVQAETVVFVVDRSASMKDDPRVYAFMRDAVERKRAEDQFGVVAVGADAAVDQPLTTRREVQPVGVEVNRHATNLAEGIRLAAAMIPSHARGKIVLLTDGLATHGDAAREAKLAAERGIAVEAVSLQQPQGEEVVLTAVQVPERLYAGEEYAIKVDVESTTATRATLRLYEGNREAGRQTIQVEKGKNRFLFTQKALQEGFQRYRVEIEPERDTVQTNNQAHAYTQVAGAPTVLVLEGHPGAAKNLVSALSAGSIKADVKDPSLLPKALDGYKRYASIILADVAATQLSDADMERMRTAVRDLGVGLIMTGGSDSFGMGGWLQTPIEEALPVHMDLRGKEDLPSLGLMLVIDKSGSMAADAHGVDKMELAKEAAIRATSMLNRQDQVGVIAFDGTPWEVVPPRPVTDLDDIHRQIGGIFADGGTDIFPALQMAYERIKTMQTQRKHVILLTDGQSGRNDDYQGLLQQMTGENITVSTVAVGDDADTALLEEIAQWGKGRYYFAKDATSVPKIFSKETALASRTYIVEQPQVPTRTGGADWSALRQPLPPLHAYVATTPKQTAEQLLTSRDEDPILIRWQYGLGRSVAWTSDLEGKWAPDWVAWPGNSRMWNEAVAWTLPQVTTGRWKAETRLDGTTGVVTVTVPKGEKLPQELEAVVVNQEMKREAVRLKPVAPGTLEGRFSAAEPGSYLVQITEKTGGHVTASETAGLTVSYSPEYGLPRDGDSELRQWLAAGEGALITRPDEVFAGRLPAKWDTQPIGEWLLMLAALLWPLDVACRRLQLPEAWWTRLAARFRRRGSAGNAGHPSVFARLGEKQEERRRGRAARREAEAADGAGQAGTAAGKSASAAAASPAGMPLSAQVPGSSLQGEAQSRSGAGSRPAAGAFATDSAAAEQTDGGKAQADSGKAQADKTGETVNRLLAAKKRRQK
jgi:Ca-activated chloride channel homolog